MLWSGEQATWTCLMHSRYVGASPCLTLVRQHMSVSVLIIQDDSVEALAALDLAVIGA